MDSNIQAALNDFFGHFVEALNLVKGSASFREQLKKLDKRSSEVYEQLPEEFKLEFPTLVFDTDVMERVPAFDAPQAISEEVLDGFLTHARGMILDAVTKGKVEALGALLAGLHKEPDQNAGNKKRLEAFVLITELSRHSDSRVQGFSRGAKLFTTF